MSEADFITNELLAILPDGSERKVVLRVGKPLRGPAPEPYICLTQVLGLEHVTALSREPLRIHGIGPMQALHLALLTVRSELDLAEQQGVQFFLDDDRADGPFDWRRCWYDTFDRHEE